MLALILNRGDSVLAENLFELYYVEVDGVWKTFRLEVLAPTSFIVTSRGGVVRRMEASPAAPREFSAGDGSRIKVLGCYVCVNDHRASGVKLRLDAPKSIRFTRPAQHGTSLRSA